METDKVIVTEPSTDKINPVKKNKILPDYFLLTIRHFLALLIWVYIILKIFFFDVDIYLLSKFFPAGLYILNFKFIIIVSALAVLLIVFRKKFIPWFLYVFFYPLIILLWKIPYFIFRQKSWTLAFAVINAMISFFKSLKYTFISFAFYIASITAVLYFSNKLLVGVSIFIIIALTIITYSRHFVSIFKPTNIFQIYIKIFSGIRKWGTAQNNGTSFFALDKNIKTIALIEMNETQIQSWTTKLQLSVLFNRLCLFVGKKLKEYQKSKLNFVYYIINFLSLVLLTIFSFTFIYFGLYKIDHTNFAYTNSPTLFTYFYYSFNSLIFNSINEIRAAQPISQIAWMVQTFLVLILGALLFSLYLSVKSDRHTEELTKVIGEVEMQGKEMEKFIQEEYKINSIADALNELKRAQAAFVNFIFKISDDL